RNEIIDSDTPKGSHLIAQGRGSAPWVHNCDISLLHPKGVPRSQEFVRCLPDSSRVDTIQWVKPLRGRRRISFYQDPGCARATLGYGVKRLRRKDHIPRIMQSP